MSHASIPEKKVIVMILDGYGYREENFLNAVNDANKPIMDHIRGHYPHTLLEASEGAVGLPDGYPGNSEVGHLTIGSGRILNQSFVRVNKAIKDGSLMKNETLISAVENCKKNGTKLHIIALLQEAGVHGHLDHVMALIDLCAQEKFHDVLIHAITDGRDAPTTYSAELLPKLEKKLAAVGFGEVVTIGGRYYAMDRDTRRERTEAAYNALMLGKSTKDPFTDALTAIKACHAAQEMDEFIVPRVKAGYKGVQPNDSIIFANFRTDRTRQLTVAITDPAFDHFKRDFIPTYFVAMTQYYAGMLAHVVFPEVIVKEVLGEVVSKAGMKQLRISETEKYPHVTFFFNGQEEAIFPGEERILIPSPKVATYDLQPEMSVAEIAEKLCAELQQEKFDLVVVNLVNADMVGHTGDIAAIVKAVEAVDSAMGRILEQAREHGYAAIIFADHGNAEDQTPEVRTSHTTALVPCILYTEGKGIALKSGRGLQDIAPTAIDILGLKKPEVMSGESLIS